MSKHRTNKRPHEYRPCEICKVGNWEETHEIFSGSDRNFSIDNNAQLRICQKCHRAIHDELIDTTRYKQEHQCRIMQEKDWSVDEWRKNGVFNGSNIRKNYL